MTNEFDRKKAKILRKIRWYYTKKMQEQKRHLFLYSSYRHFLLQNAKDSKDEAKFFLTKQVHPGAGVGDQLASLITGIYYAQKFGISYAYSNLYPLKWNDFLGFNKGARSVDSLVHEERYKKVWLPCFEEGNKLDEELIRNIMLSYSGQKVIFLLELLQIYTDQYEMKNFLQKKFMEASSNRNEAIIYKKEKINIAVHIRRGDIVQGQVECDSPLAIRWLDNHYYITILKNVVKIMEEAGKAYEIYIFSQGKVEELAEFNKFSNIIFCLDMSAMDSFLHMVYADILVSSKSSFSYNPALLSQGIRLCPQNFWHKYPQEEKWLLVDDDGQLDNTKLKVIILKYLNNDLRK